MGICVGFAFTRMESKTNLNRTLSLILLILVKQLTGVRLYMLVGGMPQAVETYLEHNNLQVVDEK